jgi:hypothetical protein
MMPTKPVLTARGETSFSTQTDRSWTTLPYVILLPPVLNEVNGPASEVGYGHHRGASRMTFDPSRAGGAVTIHRSRLVLSGARGNGR